MLRINLMVAQQLIRFGMLDGHHFAGKAWLIHKITRIKIRVPMAEVDQYLGEYERGGPRSK